MGKIRKPEGLFQTDRLTPITQLSRRTGNSRDHPLAPPALALRPGAGDVGAAGKPPGCACLSAPGCRQPHPTVPTPGRTSQFLKSGVPGTPGSLLRAVGDKPLADTQSGLRPSSGAHRMVPTALPACWHPSDHEEQAGAASRAGASLRPWHQT